jgi:predicted kinase
MRKGRITLSREAVVQLRKYLRDRLRTGRLFVIKAILEGSHESSGSINARREDKDTGLIEIPEET